MNANVQNLQSTLIVNGRIVTPGGIIEGSSLLITGNTIAGIGGNVRPPPDCVRIDAGNRIVSPGFVDLHIQGAGGADVLDGNPQSVRTIAKACTTHGVTAFLATTKFIPGTANRHIRDAVEGMRGETGGAACLGMYLESPFISGAKLGMIPPKSVQIPSEKALVEILALTGGKLRIMTVAPEIEGIAEVIAGLLENSIVPSLGHTAASYEETVRGFNLGIRHVTHLFNAMPSIHHRNPGPLPAVFEATDVTAEIICDGAHIHPAVIRTAVRLLGENRYALITDGMRGMGLPDGVFDYEGKRYDTKDGIALSADGILVGTATGLNRMIRNCMEFTGRPLEELVSAASLTPARILGIDDRKGSLKEGKDADITILNDDITVWKTFIGGREVYTAGE